MFFDKMFNNTFGLIWLIVFIDAVAVLLVWMFLKKNAVIEVEPKEVKILLNEQYKGFTIEQTGSSMFEVRKEEKVVKIFNNLEDCKVFIDVLLLRDENTSDYEIVETDGFFKVRKKNSERTLRKFMTLKEAEIYVKEKENND